MNKRQVRKHDVSFIPLERHDNEIFVGLDSKC